MQTSVALDEQRVKVPNVDVFFWIIKLLTTAMGEAASDFLVYHLNPYLAVGIGFISFVAAMVLQLWVKKFIAWIYWLNAAMVALFGTMVADIMHVVIGIPYAVSTSLFAVLLVIVLSVWFKSEKTLSIHSIYTFKRELFYWATVVTTFALGTALGDLTAFTFHLGFLTSGVLFLVVFAIPGIMRAVFKCNEILTFWFAYIMTRPLGASFADWASKPKSMTGLAYGDGLVALTLTAFIVVFVGYVSIFQQGGVIVQ
jgi:uncharacterized membrane-anchored protein